MGWLNAHLHMFKVGIIRFMVPYDSTDLIELTAIDARQVKLIHIVPHHRPFKGDFYFALEYEYDFGDSWRHEIVFEDVQIGGVEAEGSYMHRGRTSMSTRRCGGERRGIRNF